MQEGGGELGRAEPLRGRLVGLVGVDVLDQVGVEALAVADRSLEAHRVLDELEQLLDATHGKATLDGDLGDRRVAVQLLGEDAPGAHHAPHLLGDVDGQPDRPALVGERARDRLADPPRRVGRELEAEPVVELLDGPDEAEVPLLDEVEERDAGLRVVPRDRHHEAEVRLDEAALRRGVALVLQAGELALLGRGEQAPVADLPHVELQGILRLYSAFLHLFGVGLRVVQDGQELENGLGLVVGRGGRGDGLWKRPRLHRAPLIGPPGTTALTPPVLEGGIERVPTNFRAGGSSEPSGGSRGR